MTWSHLQRVLIALVPAGVLFCAGTPTQAFALNPANIYILHCAGCHGMDGAGSEQGGIPDFRGYVAAFSYLPDGRRYVLQVPGVLSSRLSEADTAAVMNYLMTRWGGTSLQPAFQAFDAAEVAQLRRTPIADVVKFRRQLVNEMATRGLPTAAYPWP